MPVNQSPLLPSPLPQRCPFSSSKFSLVVTVPCVLSVSSSSSLRPCHPLCILIILSASSSSSLHPCRPLCILVVLSASLSSSLHPCCHLLCCPSALSLVSCVLVVTAVPCAKDLCSCLCLCHRVSSRVPGHCTTLNPPSLVTSPPLSLPVLPTTPPKVS